MSKGSCLCGAVRFSAEPPFLFCAHCHCKYCRKAHAAAFVTWLGVAASRFAIASGESELIWYASSTQSRRGFCKTCGSTLFFESSLAPGEVHVALAAMDEPVERAPSVHIFFDQRVGWVDASPDLPAYTSQHPGLAKYAAVSPLDR